MMNCSACGEHLAGPGEAFTGDVCPRCSHFAHPTRLGSYEDLELIKRGGMGAVYRAQHPKLGTCVAIKVVSRTVGPENLEERFAREASLAARIPHPGVVRVFDSDVQDGRLYLVMELIEGETLRQVLHQSLQSGMLDITWCLDVVAQLADVLHAAHGVGVVHRDIKPENIMIDAVGRVRVLDFGISRLLDSTERLTMPGEILGTPEYISPEQLLDVPEAVGPRTDVYAAGVVLYELLTRRSPFGGSNLFQVLKYVESRIPPPPSQIRPEIPAELDALIMSALSKDITARPHDARVFAADLRRLAQTAQAKPQALRHKPAIARLGLALALGLSMGWLAAIGWTTRAATAPPPALSKDATAALAIRAELERSQSPDHQRLAAAVHAIGSHATPQERAWRGRARAQTGALCLALEDLQAARSAGAQGLEQDIAALEAGLDNLLPLLVRSTAAPPNTEFLGTLAETRGALADLWRAVQTVGSERDAALRDLAAAIALTTPTRYLLELAIAFGSGDIERMRAAAELAAISGEPARAMHMFVAARLTLAEQGDPRHAIVEEQLMRLCVALANVESTGREDALWKRLEVAVLARLQAGSQLRGMDAICTAAPTHARSKLAQVFANVAGAGIAAQVEAQRLVPALRIARLCGCILEELFTEESWQELAALASKLLEQEDER